MPDSYEKIRIQITRKVGSYPIKCVSCGKPARAIVSRIPKVKGLGVRTVCKHCHVSYSFMWEKIDT